MGEHGSEAPCIEQRLLRVRGQVVILDSQIAELYGVPTKRLNLQVRRNRARFPSDFMFQVNAEELIELFEAGVLRRTHGGRRYRPYAFT